jgi:hypothetical protein
MAHALIEAWRIQAFGTPPFVFQGDIIPDSKRVLIGSHEELIKSENYAVPNPRFHLGLLPVPFMGDLEKADI